ncbi:unnamed protein product [Dicrocoelium dendriticum]|nr:unnamed protein product [Dicrocoelium dendriticum]
MIIKCVRRTISASAEPFLPLEIRGLTDVRALTRRNRSIDERKEPLHRKFSEKIDWTNIWPAASTFHYSVIPFPIRQGYCKNLQENLGISPGSYANAELLKIPNFLHLTKHHIQKHCAAIKKFCTKWPTGLNSEEAVTKHYPLEVVHQNFVFSAPSIRDPRARLVSIRVAVSSLRLNDHSKRKLIRLAMGPGPGKNFAQYDWSTDILQLSSSRCPTSRQNTDYLRYVLTVLTLESKNGP